MNPSLLRRIQVGVLASGTLFSWATLILDYRRFFAAGGRVLELSGCAVANPVATPCFYGALAFLIALVWAIVILRSAPAMAARRQRGLHWLLLAGTLFAWGNFAYEVYRYFRQPAAPSPFACPPGEAVGNPLLAPCFYGALIFMTALMVSLLIRRSRR